MCFQVYNLYGSNSSINVSVTEYSIQLQWLPEDLNTTYLIRHKVSTDTSGGIVTDVTMPDDNSTAIEEEIAGLYPGQQYTIEVEKDGIGLFLDNITTSKL